MHQELMSFPEIRNISDVLPYIRHRPEIVARTEGGITTLQYNIAQPDTFQDLENPIAGKIRSECRGIAFRECDGGIVSRPFHKFHNIGEFGQAGMEDVDWSLAGRAPVKYDGTMVRPLMIHGQFQLATKRGAGKQARRATEFLQSLAPEKSRSLEALYRASVTPILEWVDPDDPMVVQYEEPQLILLAARDNVTGCYLDVEDLGCPFPIAQEHPLWSAMGDAAPQEKVAALASKTEEEGVVIWFGGQHPMKVKTRWFHNVHKFISLIGQQDVRHHIVGKILNDQLDDLVPFLPDAKREFVETIQRNFFRDLDAKLSAATEAGQALSKTFEGDRSAIAKFLYQEADDLPKLDKTVVMAGLEGKDVRAEILGLAGRNTGAGSKWDRIQTWLADNGPLSDIQNNPHQHRGLIQ